MLVDDHSDQIEAKHWSHAARPSPLLTLETAEKGVRVGVEQRAGKQARCGRLCRAPTQWSGWPEAVQQPRARMDRASPQKAEWVDRTWSAIARSGGAAVEDTIRYAWPSQPYNAPRTSLHNQVTKLCIYNNWDLKMVSNLVHHIVHYFYTLILYLICGMYSNTYWTAWKD